MHRGQREQERRGREVFFGLHEHVFQSMEISIRVLDFHFPLSLHLRWFLVPLIITKLKFHLFSICSTKVQSFLHKYIILYSINQIIKCLWFVAPNGQSYKKNFSYIFFKKLTYLIFSFSNIFPYFVLFLFLFLLPVIV